MLDWIFEGIVTWISSVVSDMMDAVSGLFLQALGTDMTAMEEYFPFVSKAFTVMQYTAWALLFLITVWQLFRVFGGPVTEAENPWVKQLIRTIVNDGLPIQRRPTPLEKSFLLRRILSGIIWRLKAICFRSTVLKL